MHAIIDGMGPCGTWEAMQTARPCWASIANSLLSSCIEWIDYKPWWAKRSPVSSTDDCSLLGKAQSITQLLAFDRLLFCSHNFLRSLDGRIDHLLLTKEEGKNHININEWTPREDYISTITTTTTVCIRRCMHIPLSSSLFIDTMTEENDYMKKPQQGKGNKVTKEWRCGLVEEASEEEGGERGKGSSRCGEGGGSGAGGRGGGGGGCVSSGGFLDQGRGHDDDHHGHGEEPELKSSLHRRWREEKIKCIDDLHRFLERGRERWEWVQVEGEVI